MTKTEQREALIEAARIEREGGTEDVLALLESPHAKVRLFIVMGLRRRNQRGAIPALQIRLATEEDAKVRSAIVNALAQFRDPSTNTTLVDLLGDESEDVRRLALRGLSRLRDPRTVPAAKQMYETSGLPGRAEALDALVTVQIPEAGVALEELGRSQRSWIRRRAVRSATRRFQSGMPRG